MSGQKIYSPKVLVTGSNGFIGFHLVQFLLEKNFKVIGIDNLSSVSKYTQKLRTKILKNNRKFKFYKIDLKKPNSLAKVTDKIDLIIHLAAQPGVRFSMEQPVETFSNNINGYINLLEFAKKKKIKSIIYASSSSTYGNTKTFKESNLDFKNITSIYAGSKIASEIVSNIYHKLFNINFIGLRFFTVFGEFGREDMAYYKFLNQIIKNRKITIYGNTSSKRSFTHVSDVVKSIYILTKKIKYKKKINISINIGNPKQVTLKYLIKIIKSNYPIKFKESFLKKNLSDVDQTKTNILLFKKLVGDIKFSEFKKNYISFIKWHKKLFLSNK